MKRILSALLIALALPAFVAAAGKASQKLVLEFVEGSSLTVTMADKSVAKLGSGIFEGDEIPAGAVVATGPDTSAELKIKPNGTILRIAKSTTFRIATLAGPSQGKNAFALVAGKVRAVAAKGGEYEMSSKTAVCAVRGTDFAFSVDEGAKAELMVAKGLVQFDKLDDSGALLGSLSIGAGQAADAFAATFASFAYSPEQFAQAFEDLGFQKLKESDVPEKAIDTEEGQAGEQAQATDQSPAQAEPKDAAKGAAAAPESGLVKWLRDMLGFEIGAVTIDSKTYSKAVIQPELALGKAKLGLYLPIVYSSNLFDPDDWYKPAGNSEWDFGSSRFAQGDNWGGAADLARDLALKVKYFEYGAQYRDPFYVKLGNLEGLTLGHGILMRNYANDSDFPSVRRLGFNLGYDGSGGGIELVANDLSNWAVPEIFGARLFVHPIPGYKFAMGVQGLVDWAPAGNDASLAASAGDLKIVGGAADLELPIVQSDLFGLRFFADAGATIPYSSSTYAGVTGFQYQLVYDKATGEVKNWGAAGGVIGNVLFIDYRLEYRYTTGYFRTSLFDSTYDRMRAQYAAQYLKYLSDPSSYASLPDVMGVYGEGGFKILKDKLGLTIGYYWPWSLEAGTDIQKQLVSSSDELHLKLTIKKGLIPFIDLAGAVYYDKRGLAKSIADQSLSLLDSNTSFGGEVDIPVPKTPNLDLALLFATTPVYNADGSIRYSDESKGIVELKPSVSIETRFHL